MLMHTINGIICNKPLVALCDLGSSHCLLNKAALPFGAPTIKTQPILTTTTQGSYQCNEAALMTKVSLPEFVNGQKINNIVAQVFESSNCLYDVILGRDFMNSIGLDIQFSSNSVKWLDTIIDIKHISVFDHKNQDVTDIGIQAGYRKAMLAWSQYQQDMLLDDLEYRMERDFEEL